VGGIATADLALQRPEGAGLPEATPHKTDMTNTPKNRPDRIKGNTAGSWERYSSQRSLSNESTTTQSNSKRKYTDFMDTAKNNNRHCYEGPLRLRGGGDNDSNMPHAASSSGDMGIAGGQKRGPPSPVSPDGQTVKQIKTAGKQSGELDELIGWLEQTVVQEKEKKKLAMTVAEKMLGKLSRLRTLTRTITHENSRLAGEIKGKEDAQRESLTVFKNKLDAKNAETRSLTAELASLKSGCARSRAV